MRLSDFPIKELKSVLKSDYERVIKQANRAESITPSAAQTDKLPKLPYMASQDTEEVEEAYWQGEELRKKTPASPTKCSKIFPPFSTLAFSTTAASENGTFQMHMQDNGTQRSIIFNTEAQTLNKPDTIYLFYEELPDVFTTDATLRTRAKYNFSLRKVARLLNTLNILKINNVLHEVYEKLK